MSITSIDFRVLALANGIIPSVGHTGICYDNAMAESFNATIKKELIHLHTFSRDACSEKGGFRVHRSLLQS